MAASLSEGEFHRMQLQLIELRTKNYELEGRNKKLERELSEVQEKQELLESELLRAKQTIIKSKKVKDVESILRETDLLQRKLQSQEEEFRLQNQTLMAELAMLVSNNEELKKELEAVKREDLSEAVESEPGHGDELRRLQAENIALQRSLNVLKGKHEQEVLAQPYCQDVVTRLEVLQQDGIATTGIEWYQLATEDQVDSSSAEVSLSNLKDTINKLRLELDTEREEKLIIKTELEQKLKDSTKKITMLQEELEEALKKLKRKQDSYQQLHAEKELLFKESSCKLEDSQAARDRDHKYYQDLLAKLQADSDRVKQEYEQQLLSVTQQLEKSSLQVTQLRKQIDASADAGSQQLQEQACRFQADFTALTEANMVLRREKEDLLTQLVESQRVAEDSVVQMQAAQTERDAQITALQEISKVAEKRKALLDELAIKYQKECDLNREHVQQMEAAFTGERHNLQLTANEQSKKIADLNKQILVIEELNKKVHFLEETKSSLEIKLAEAQEQVSSLLKNHGLEKETLITNHRVALEELTLKRNQEHELLCQEKELLEEHMKETERNLHGELESLRNEINHLKQIIKDSEDEKKLHEKKGMTMLKDLKRQLHSERKRAEKLQGKLQEVLSESNGKSFEEWLRSSNTETVHGDASSVSSWGASGYGKDSAPSSLQSPVSGNGGFLGEPSVGDDCSDLINRIGLLQQEKWTLEEKVNHLEISNSCMAEDLLNKTSIIEHYVMDSRSGARHSTSHEDKLSLKKVMDLVNKGSDSNQQTQDMNKKLQSMLEETLTKNMHLQQHLELMSQEVVRLSKLTAVLPEKAVTPPSTLLLVTQSTSSSTEPASYPSQPTLLTSPDMPPGDSEESSVVDVSRENDDTSEDNFEVISNTTFHENPELNTVNAPEDS